MIYFSLSSPTNQLVISLTFDNFVHFRSSFTRSSSASKLVHQSSVTNSDRHFYFCRISRLWNALPQIDMDLSPTTIKNLLTQYFWSHFLDNFDSNNICTFHYCCPCSNCTNLTKPAPLFSL